MAVGAAFFSGGSGPTDEELESFGLTRDDVVNPEEEILVWPEHWVALELFTQLLTQWRTGFKGATGIDYAVMPFIFKVNGIKQKDQLARFDELRIMERAALEEVKK